MVPDAPDFQGFKMIDRSTSWILRHPKAILFGTILATLLSLFLASKIKIRTNLSDLLPDNHPAVQQARKLEEVVGGASFIVVAVETKNPEAAGRFIDDLHARLEAAAFQGIRTINDHPPADFLKKSGLLYLSSADLDQLKSKIKRRIDQGRLKKAHLYIDFEEEENDEFLEPHSHYQNHEGTLFVSLIKPNWRATDVAKTQTFLDQLDQTVKRLSPLSYDPSLRVCITGPYVKAAAQKRIVVRDATLISTFSFIAAILYLILHFKRKRPVFLVGLPLTISVFWSLGLAYLLYGSLNLFSSVACAILLGLSADYGIHLYSEYSRHREQGESVHKALQLALNHLMRAFFIASTTTTTAFLSLGFTQFKALHEFGFIAGFGIVLCALSFVLLFPPLVIFTEKWRPLSPVTSTLKREANHPPFLNPFSRRTFVLTSLLLLLPLSAIALGHLRFDYNLNNILGEQPTKKLDRKVDGIFGRSVNPEVALTGSLGDAKKLSSSIRAAAEQNSKTERGTTIQGVLSLADFVPSDQREKIRKIREIRPLFTESVIKNMNADERKSYETFKSMLQPRPITLGSLPPEILNPFQDREGKTGRIVFIFPNFERAQGDRFLQFVEEIRKVECRDCQAPFFIAGESTVYYEIIKMIFREGHTVIGFALITVFGTLWLNFRSFSSALLVFSPLVLGIVGMIGWMALFNIPFNILNLAALPIILGTADDYAIHFYQRLLDHPERSLEETWKVTSGPILGSAITTLIGFGSLLMANMGGIRSFGLVCVIGISLCAIATLLWFPAMLALKK